MGSFVVTSNTPASDLFRNEMPNPSDAKGVDGSKTCRRFFQLFSDERIMLTKWAQPSLKTQAVQFLSTVKVCHKNGSKWIKL